MTLRGLFLGVLRKCFNTTIYRIHFLTKEINEEELSVKMKGLKIPAKELEYNDFQKGDTTIFDDKKMALYRKRFKDGNYKPYGVVYEDKLAYSSWLSFEMIGLPIDAKPIYLKANEGYLEDDFCSPEYRGRGIHTQMIWFRLNELQKAGRDTAIITILNNNEPALKAATKCGFMDKGVFYDGKILGLKFCTLKHE